MRTLVTLAAVALALYLNLIQTALLAVGFACIAFANMLRYAAF